MVGGIYLADGFSGSSNGSGCEVTEVYGRTEPTEWMSLSSS